ALVALSDDGRYRLMVEASSDGMNIVVSYSIVDRITHLEEPLVFEAFGGGMPDGSIGVQSASGDLRYLMFYSDATNLVSEPVSAALNVYRWDRLTGTATLVSIGRDGTGVGGFDGTISDDGRFAAFTSNAGEELVAGDPAAQIGEDAIY